VANAIAELEQAAGLASQECVAAEGRERQALLHLEQAKAELADAANRRAELADALVQAQTLEDAGLERLDAARASAADTARQLDAQAAKAAAGGDVGASVKRIAALQSQRRGAWSASWAARGPG
jgi:hypothetical protein